MLVQQMASAFELNLRWQQLVVQRMEEEAWQGERDKRRALENMSPAQRERHQAYEGWLPPRLAESDALEQAVMMADRYQRAFLRLLKAFRENRRLFEALIVAGGQVNIAARLHALLTEAGLPRQRFHDLRHCAASLLLAGGVAPRTIMGILGHSQISLTMNTYAHLSPELEQDAADRLDALLTMAH